MKKFTKRARRAIAVGCMEAQSMRNAYLGTEHLLLGLIGVRCAASDVLQDLGADLTRLEEKVVEIVGERTMPVPGPQEIDMDSLGAAIDRATPRLNRAFDRSRIEASALCREEVGTEHLLLGLLDDPKSVAAEAIHGLGLSDDDIRRKVETQQ